MNTNRFLLALALSTTAWSAAITIQPGPNGTYVDLVIAGVGGAQVGAYQISIDYNPNLVDISGSTSLGSLGISGVQTLWQTQTSPLGSNLQQLDLFEVSLLSTADLLALQSGTFGLARLSLQWHTSGTALFSVSGIVGNAVGDPINTTFTNRLLSSPSAPPVSGVPEPGTLSLLVAAAAGAGGFMTRRLRIVTHDQTS